VRREARVGGLAVGWSGEADPVSVDEGSWAPSSRRPPDADDHPRRGRVVAAADETHALPPLLARDLQDFAQRPGGQSSSTK
jgi:hypothetical protein